MTVIISGFSFAQNSKSKVVQKSNSTQSNIQTNIQTNETDDNYSFQAKFNNGKNEEVSELIKSHFDDVKSNNSYTKKGLQINWSKGEVSILLDKKIVNEKTIDQTIELGEAIKELINS